jgi:hypothetical protein
MEIRFSSSARKDATLRNKSPLPEKLKYWLPAKSESPMTAK